MLQDTPQAPELNRIKQLWDLSEKTIRQHAIKSNETLRNVIREDWQQINAEETKRLVNSMTNRLYKHKTT